MNYRMPVRSIGNIGPSCCRPTTPIRFDRTCAWCGYYSPCCERLPLADRGDRDGCRVVYGSQRIDVRAILGTVLDNWICVRLLFWLCLHQARKNQRGRLNSAPSKRALAWRTLRHEGRCNEIPLAASARIRWPGRRVDGNRSARFTASWESHLRAGASAASYWLGFFPH